MTLSPNDPVEVLLSDGTWKPAAFVRTALNGSGLYVVRFESGLWLTVLPARVRRAAPAPEPEVPADVPYLVRAKP